MPGRRRRDPDGPGRPGGHSAPSRVIAGRAFLRGRLQPVEVGVSEDGWIVRIGRDLRAPDRVDLGDRVILPAATDLHVHLRDPGGPHASESIPTGTRGAALGGVTLVGEMPNTEPPVTDPESLDAKARRVRGRAAVDVLLYALAQRPHQVAALARSTGAFKLYLSPTTQIPDAPAEADLGPLLRAVAATQLPLSVHAEDPTAFSEPQAVDAPGWNAARPAEAERRAVERVLAAAPPNLRLHLAHTTNVEATELVRRHGDSFEVTPHHLLLSEGAPGRSRVKVNPPLRTEAVRRALWNEFCAGRAPCLASDHAPHPIEEKDRPFPLAPSGMPGVQTLLPLLLSRVREHRPGGNQ